MLTTPLSRLNISCPCTECSTFLRPLPKDPPPLSYPTSPLPPDLLPSPLGFSLTPTPAITPKLTPKPTPHATPRLRPTVPTLAPSPSFLLTRSSPSKSKQGSKDGPAGPLALPSLELGREPTWSKRVTFASRALWANTSSPIDEASTPISAKTPGFAVCAQEMCVGKVVPGFGRTVCGACKEELRGAVLGLMAVRDDEEVQGKRRGEASRTLSRADSVLRTDSVLDSAFKHDSEEETNPEPFLFAIPSTSPSTKLLLRHSLYSAPQRDKHAAEKGAAEQRAEPALFALPNTSLDKTYEDFTPTTKYAMDFPALPANSNASKRSSGEIVKPTEALEAGSKAGSKRSSREILTATESMMFFLRESNSSMKWRLCEN